MAVEVARGCGYRKVGGLYLVGGGASMQCDRLPYEIVNCPTCGSGIKFSRGFTWLDWFKYAGIHVIDDPYAACTCPNTCPICVPESGSYGLLWIGERYYSPENFVKEVLQMGACRRIAAIPKGLKLGETLILFAHKHVIPFKNDKNEDDFKPAIFYVFRPTGLELLIWESEATPEKIAELEKKHITPIIIPDGDKDHDPATPLGLNSDEKVEVENRMFFTDLKNRLGR